MYQHAKFGQLIFMAVEFNFVIVTEKMNDYMHDTVRHFVVVNWWKEHLVFWWYVIISVPGMIADESKNVVAIFLQRIQMRDEGNEQLLSCSRHDDKRREGAKKNLRSSSVLALCETYHMASQNT